MSKIITLPAGNILTATPGEGKYSLTMVEDSTIGGVFSAAMSMGPYMLDRSFTYSGDVTVTTAASNFVLASILSYGAAAPVDAVRASLAFNPTGDDNGLTITAVEYGVGRNDISIEYTDPGANSATLSVSVFRKAISVSLATDGSGTITTTAADVIAALSADVDASALVTAAVDTSDSGIADDGSGIVTAMAQDYLESGAGTAIGVLLPGGLYLDTDGGDVYRNSGTLAVPAFTQLADVA